MKLLFLRAQICIVDALLSRKMKKCVSIYDEEFILSIFIPFYFFG